jgi:hypothetical protein
MLNPILRLTWSQTNDYFDIEVENAEFAGWFVEQCNRFGNTFVYTDDNPTQQDQLISELKDNIQEVNRFLKKINFPELPVLDDMCSQHNLNLGHKTWISIVRKEPKIDKLLYHYSPELFKKFHNINRLIHRIETKFEYTCLGNPNWRVENKFKNTVPTYGVYNVSIGYTDWGKSIWHKFKDGIDQPVDFELNEWNSIGSDLKINLCNPYTLAFPPDYLDYCAQHQVTPGIDTWPLGNLVDYKNTMPQARNIMNKNIQIPNNSLNFSIV